MSDFALVFVCIKLKKIVWYQPASGKPKILFNLSGILLQTCQKPEVKDVLFHPTQGKRSLISSHKHVLFCPILKAGSTNILRLMCWFYGPPCTEIEHLYPHNMVPQ